MTKRAVVLLSGGLDSATALYWAGRRGYQTSALSVDYGQRHRRELESARRLARAAGADLTTITLSLPWLPGSTSLVGGRKPLPDIPLGRIGRNGVPSTYVPGRNTVFLSLALSFADARDAQAIVIGANTLDSSGYPDCRPAYLRAFEKTARLGSRAGARRRPLRILAPLLRLNKRGIVKLAMRLGVPLEKTWSCYRGGNEPCRRCDSCKLRAKGFDEAAHKDPLVD
jgi:7-cyano-7-deazaguanine synthase